MSKDKTTIFFNLFTLENIRQEIKDALGLQEITQYKKYLGLPSLIGRKKKEIFNYIKEKVWRKLQGWKGKLLPQAGREILIKAVFQAILTFTVGCFKIPLGLCHDIEALVKKFWWGQRGDRRKIHWLKWDKLTKSKLEGRLLSMTLFWPSKRDNSCKIRTLYFIKSSMLGSFLSVLLSKPKIQDRLHTHGQASYMAKMYYFEAAGEESRTESQ